MNYAKIVGIVVVEIGDIVVVGFGTLGKRELAGVDGREEYVCCKILQDVGGIDALSKGEESLIDGGAANDKSLFVGTKQV